MIDARHEELLSAAFTPLSIVADGCCFAVYIMPRRELPLSSPIRRCTRQRYLYRFIFAAYAVFRALFYADAGVIIAATRY